MADIPADLRRLVAERAELCCEYCLLPEAFAFRKHEPDHIIPRQHGGETSEANLALACARCNRAKGPNLGSLDAETGDLVRFFDPRRDAWSDHFRLDGGLIVPLTAQGRVTVKIFQLNQPHRLAERLRLLDAP
jgi:HNH endonuclease